MKYVSFLTAHQLSVRLGRTDRGVRVAIERLRIRPAVVIARKKFYRESALETLKNGMRAKKRDA